MDWYNGMWNYIRNFPMRAGYKYFSAICNSWMVLLQKASRGIQFSFWINTRGDCPAKFYYLGINVMVHEKMLSDSQVTHLLHLLLAFGLTPSTSYLFFSEMQAKNHTHTLSGTLPKEIPSLLAAVSAREGSISCACTQIFKVLISSALWSSHC